VTSLAPRSDFPLLAANPDLHYLDSAATSQKPRAVLDAIARFYETSNANPHRGAYELSVKATDAYHGARERIARYFGVRDAATLIFTRGTTEAINLVATAWGGANVSEGDEIIVTAMEHHANFVPWQQLAIAKRSDAAASGAGAVRVRPTALCWPSAVKRYQYQRPGSSPAGSAWTLCAQSFSARSRPFATTRSKRSSAASSQRTSTASGRSLPISRVQRIMPSARG